MKSVFDEYQQLWPVSAHAGLKPHLSRVPVLHYPEDKQKLTQVLPAYVVLVVKKASFREIFALMEMGFEHVVQRDREDFPQELLASSLMVLRPDAFTANPIPFFFSGFRPPDEVNPDKNLTMRFQKSTEKPMLLEWLTAFLAQSPKTSSLREICVQAADEMITNAIFNAPVRPSGKRPFQALGRDAEIELPSTQAATLFASFSDTRIVIGCTDLFGSLDKETLMVNLRSQFKEDTVKLRDGHGGAGLGFRYLIENSANFYLLVSKSKSTLVASAFLLSGLRVNMAAHKHFHFSFR